ncbi:MAG: undecaprenyl-diphosphate phosphatase [Candidatus Hydrogenedentes bacterium]|nr:undecaprenyl-diphosphate phosphatase [Candidatus Hydrogenedentota bacterium]MBI3117701.1 undecaprenyl-diphosphate phosphatase [Candidatus Hydrogenedentota bacterium]
MDFFKAFLLAVVEGVTEFLPISSTGHLILLEDYLQLGTHKEFTDSFLVIIQLPAIFSVVLYFWRDLWPFHRHNNTAEVLRLWFLTAVAFLPAAVFGLLLHDWIKEILFHPVPIAIALILGGALLILIERREYPARFPTVHHLGWRNALGIGAIQCLAMLPGTSRSAATIIGAMLLGAGRGAAAEFSFFLAVPTMLGATTIELLDSGFAFSRREWLVLLFGSLVSFAVAYGVIAFLMRFIKKHTFTSFGYYRIALGALVLALLFVCRTFHVCFFAAAPPS